MPLRTHQQCPNQRQHRLKLIKRDPKSAPWHYLCPKCRQYFIWNQSTKTLEDLPCSTHSDGIIDGVSHLPARKADSTARPRTSAPEALGDP